MPYYDYVCAECGNEIEVMHSVHADGPTVCPKCGGSLKKTFAAPAVHFKGSGWARKERSNSGKPGRPDRKESAASPGDGGESAPVASSDAGTSSSGPEPVATETAVKDAPAKEHD